jgi:dynamin 1-like protein
VSTANQNQFNAEHDRADAQNHIADVQMGGNSWLSNILPPPTRTESVESSASNTPTHSVLSPHKPVNLLPEVPIHNNARKLTDKEQKDCDIIGQC